MDEATQESLKQLKKILLSLVCSNASRMDVNNLKRDYADQERDGRIPVNKYGHKDLISFLTTECRDIFLVSTHFFLKENNEKNVS